MSEEPARVLIIDDEQAFGEMVSEVLGDSGYETVLATDPAAAIERAAGGGFAVAVVDLVMPGMGGLQVAEKIKASSPETEILILTGHADIESAVEGIQRGVFDYLQKQSMPIAKLQRSVLQAVEKWRLSRENHALVDRLRESNRLLKALHEVSTNLASESYLDRLLSMLVTAAKELCHADAGRAMLFRKTHGDDALIIEVAVGDGGEAVRGARLQPGQGLALMAAEENVPILAPRPTEHERYSHRCDELPTRLPGFLVAPLHHGSVRGALALAGRSDGQFGSEDRVVLASLALHAAVGIENALYHDRFANFFTHSSEMLVSILESMDIFFPGHSKASAALADMVSRRLGLGDTERRNIHFGAMLHDIGKILLDPAILKAPGRPTPEQMRHLQQHCALGVEMLKPITMWEDILPVIHAHHERWDGKGYPMGMSGEAIPLGARIVAVADSFDAMTRATTHGKTHTLEHALAELEACSGKQYDPAIVRVFVAEFREHSDQLKL